MNEVGWGVELAGWVSCAMLWLWWGELQLLGFVQVTGISRDSGDEVYGGHCGVR